MTKEDANCNNDNQLIEGIMRKEQYESTYIEDLYDECQKEIDRSNEEYDRRK